jgi:hypothetical protein
MARKFFSNFFTILSYAKPFRRIGEGPEGLLLVLVLVLVLEDPDVSDRITEQNNCEAIGLFSLQKTPTHRGRVLKFGI